MPGPLTLQLIWIGRADVSVLRLDRGHRSRESCRCWGGRNGHELQAVLGGQRVVAVGPRRDECRARPVPAASLRRRATLAMTKCRRARACDGNCARLASRGRTCRRRIRRSLALRANPGQPAAVAYSDRERDIRTQSSSPRSSVKGAAVRRRALRSRRGLGRWRSRPPGLSTRRLTGGRCESTGARLGASRLDAATPGADHVPSRLPSASVRSADRELGGRDRGGASDTNA